MFYTASDLAVVSAIRGEMATSITHKCHDEKCDCDVRRIHGLEAMIGILLRDVTPAAIGERLRGGLLPESLKLFLEEHPDVRVEIPQAAWMRCLPWRTE